MAECKHFFNALVSIVYFHLISLNLYMGYETKTLFGLALRDN